VLQDSRLQQQEYDVHMQYRTGSSSRLRPPKVPHLNMKIIDEQYNTINATDVGSS